MNFNPKHPVHIYRDWMKCVFTVVGTVCGSVLLVAITITIVIWLQAVTAIILNHNTNEEGAYEQPTCNVNTSDNMSDN